MLAWQVDIQALQQASATRQRRFELRFQSVTISIILAGAHAACLLSSAWGFGSGKGIRQTHASIGLGQA
jgi:hypothetical protein